MKAVRVDESIFDALAKATGEDLISVFIPTHRRGRDVAQDRIRLKNQLAEADGALDALGWKPRRRTERLAGARELLDDVEFWEHQDDGLAVYIADDGSIEAYSMARSVPTETHIMSVYMLRPLIGELSRFQVPVLGLSRDEAVLYMASSSEAELLDTDLPAYADVNWFVDREKQRQQHPDRAGTSRNRHGHEASSGNDEDLSRFLREIDAAISDFGPESQLIVLGDRDLVARFGSVSSRKIITADNGGLETQLSADEIHERSASLIADLEARRVDEALADIGDQVGMGMGTTRFEEALAAAAAGRVSRLVVERNARPIWGRFDESTLEVESHEEQRPGDVDLLDRLVVWSRLHGSDIVASEAGIESHPFMVSFRY